MAFISLLILYALFAMFLFGAFCALACLALGLIYRRKRKRWMKLATILAAAFAAVNLAIPAAFFVWAMSF